MPSSLPMTRRTRALTLALVLAGIAPAPSLTEDFTFRRIGVAPQSGAPRITVQIDPEEQARRIAPPSLSAPVPPRAPEAPEITPDTPAQARFGWFWTRVQTGLAQGEGRFLSAMAALRDAPDDNRVPEPSVQHLQDIAEAHGPAILGATVGTRVSPALALAVIAVESGGRPRAVSRAGAQGLMQLIPATAERFGVADAMDSTQNIRGGVAYLDWLLGEFDNDVVLALAGYNAGEGAVRRAGGVPPLAETRDYVPKVLAAWNIARGLCTTQPELPSDGCVFAVRAVQRTASAD
ncbi:MAG: lytic transglycosylase domain-containing protein [Pararhodobacter sp.]